MMVFSGRAVCLLRPNIDTDIIIPQTELITLTKKGLGKGLFARWRYYEDRTLNMTFALNFSENKVCQCLIAAENFGCGSSREHAVWSLLDYGIRVVIAPSFGDIFMQNCVRNGLLPAVVSADTIAWLATQADKFCGLTVSVDLERQLILVDENTISFSINAQDKERLQSGRDAIAETEGHQAVIEAFILKDKTQRPWVYDSSWK